MRVSLINGATTYPLAGESGVAEAVHSSASELRIDATAGSQIVTRLRAANATPIDRLNLRHTVSFGTTRVFSTVAAAEQYAADYDRTVPRSGVLMLEPTGGDPGDTRYLHDAVVAPPARVVIGCSVLLRYTVAGSRMSEGMPAIWEDEIPWEQGANWEE